MVGSRLAAKLASQGNKVRVITRNVNSARGKLQYPGLEFFSITQTADAIRGADAVVNLAGEPIGTRWAGKAVLILCALSCVLLGYLLTIRHRLHSKGGLSKLSCTPI